jgi:hypothetical protein
MITIFGFVVIFPAFGNLNERWHGRLRRIKIYSVESNVLWSLTTKVHPHSDHASHTLDDENVIQDTVNSKYRKQEGNSANTGECRRDTNLQALFYKQQAPGKYCHTKNRYEQEVK